MTNTPDTQGKGLKRLLIWCYTLAVVPCVLIIGDMVRVINGGGSIAAHVFLLFLLGPVAAVTVWVSVFRFPRGN